MSDQLDLTALTTCLQDLDHLFIDISRLTQESGYDEQIGGYGIVRVSTLDSGAPGAVLVAAKTIHIKNRHKEPQRLAFRLARELKIWAGFRHPHVLPLLGYYLDKDYRIAVLISQYMIHGDLKEYIDRQNPSWDVRLHLVCDLTDGLAYLHGQTPPVLHGDLKMKNVLVSASRRGMLADFGLSKALEDGSTGLTTSDGLKGTLRCYSPELLKDENSKHSLPRDIWAWGCLVLEALANRIPYAEKKMEHSIILALMNNEPPSDTESLSLPVADLKNLLGRCWTVQPCERPSAIDCFRVIESALPTPRLVEDIDRTTAPHDSLHQGSPSLVLGINAANNFPQSHQTVAQSHQQSQPECSTSALQLYEFFRNAFNIYSDERQIAFEPQTVEGKEVELHQLFLMVGALGGGRAVAEKQLWSAVGAKLGLPESGSQANQASINQLSAIYQNVLSDFETYWHTSLRSTDPNATFPLPHHLQVLRPEIEELASALLHSRQKLYSSTLGEENSLRERSESRFRGEVNEIISLASKILGNRPVPILGKHLPRQQPSASQPFVSGKYDAKDVADLLEMAKQLGLESLELRALAEVDTWAAGWDRRAGAMLTELHQASPNAPLDRAGWDTLFSEAFSHNYDLRRFNDVGRVVKRIRLLEELRDLQDTALTMEDVEELQRQAVNCHLPPENEQAVKLKELAKRGSQWCEYAEIVLEQPVIALEDLNKLVAPPCPVPVFPSLLETIDTVRGRAREIEKQAKAILYPSVGRRTPIADAQRLVSNTQKDFLISAIQILAEVAPQAAHIEKTCFDIINNRYSPQASHKPLFEELRDTRNTVQKKLGMFMIPSFDIVDQQLVQHDAWLEKLPWYRTPEPAMQDKLIVDDVVHNTRPEDDKPPTDPECTCICPHPVKVTVEKQADAVQCDHCGAKFHSKCIEGSCPFCDHQHWNGSLTKTRNFKFTDLLPIVRAAPDLTRNYSLAWKHMDIIITYVDRLTKAFDVFLATVTEATINPPATTFIPQTRHFLRKLYKMQFSISIKARPDLPSYGLTLCHLHRVLANNTKASQDTSQRKKAQRRPKFVFTAEVMRLATDGSRCLCKGSHVGDRLIACNSCSYNFHGCCVRYDEANNPAPKPWRCPMCMIRKGKQYPQSAVRVRTVAEQEADVYVDTKACLENYSWQLIRQRLPPPTDYTIILELERFIPGSNLYPESSLAAKPPAAAPQPQSSAGPSTPTTREPSQTPMLVVPSAGLASPASLAPDSSDGSSSAIIPHSRLAKRKVPASPATKNLRRSKRLLGEGGKASS